MMSSDTDQDTLAAQNIAAGDDTLILDKEEGKSWGRRFVDTVKYIYFHLPAIIPASLATYVLFSLSLIWGWQNNFWYFLVVLTVFVVLAGVFWAILLFLHNQVERVYDETKRFRYSLLFAAYLFLAYAGPLGYLGWELSGDNYVVAGLVAAISGIAGYFMFKARRGR